MNAVRPFDLIICDVDGTLIQDYDRGLDPRLFPLVRRLHAAGFLFCVASGRQYVNLRAVFSEIFDITHFIAENGGGVFYHDELEEVTPMERETALQLARAIDAHPYAELMISGPLEGYVHHPSNAFKEGMRKLTNWKVIDVDHLEDTPDPMLKVSGFVTQDIEKTYAEIAPYKGHFKGAIAGPAWIDFTEGTKGLAASKFCEDKGISLDRVLFFGDQYNDVPLYKIAPHSYAMPASPIEVKQAAGLGVCDNICDRLEALLEEVGG